LKTVPAPHAEHHLVRLHAGDTLPETLISHLREHKVTGGWLRLSGVLADVEVRAYSAEIEGHGGVKRIAGPVQAIILDGNVGVAQGNVSVELRVVLGRETDAGLETVGGELVRARVVGLEGSMVVLEGTVVPRATDKASGVSLFTDGAVVSAAPPRATEAAPPAPSAHVPPARPSTPAVPAPAPSWSDAVAASAAPPPPARPPVTTRPSSADDDSDEGPYPQAGDMAEHFAFGTCEVLKSDGDRLHVRMKDGRIREIALEMLKVVPLPAEGGVHRFRLSRKG
jgi:predicted DNA-binding protein with PD1-like motif